MIPARKTFSQALKQRQQHQPPTSDDTEAWLPDIRAPPAAGVSTFSAGPDGVIHMFMRAAADVFLREGFPLFHMLGYGFANSLRDGDYRFVACGVHAYSVYFHNEHMRPEGIVVLD